jgi:hypothetical protein
MVANKKLRARYVTDAARVAASLVLDRGQTHEQAARAAGLGSELSSRLAEAYERGRRDERADPIVDPSTLTRSAQEKLAAVIRQHIRQLDVQYEQRVQEGVRRFLETATIPDYKNNLFAARKVLEARKGIMSAVDYRLVVSCLHPDSRRSLSEAELAEAFDVIAKLRTVLVSEKEMPVAAPEMPRTYDEWEAMKRKASEARRAKRGGGTVVRKAGSI